MKKVFDDNEWQIYLEIEHEQVYGFWVRRNDIGVMMYMFGLPCDNLNVLSAIEIAKNNIDEYKKIYTDLYIWEE